MLEVNRFTPRREVLRQGGRTSDGWSAVAWTETIMSKANDTSKFATFEHHDPLADRELDAVTGGRDGDQFRGRYQLRLEEAPFSPPVATH